MEDITAETAPESTEPEPVVDSAPSQAEPEPAPDLPEVEPTWLDEPDEPERPAYNQADYPQSYHTQPQEPQKPPSKNVLESFVNDPEGTLDKLVTERMMQHLGPMAYQLQNTQLMSQQFIRAQAQSSIQQARKAIENGYKEVLNKDEAFRGHKGVRTRVESAMKGMYQQAAQAAMQGDPRRLSELSSPVFLKAALYIAKELEGYKPRAAGEYAPAGASVESTRPRKGSTSAPALDPTTEAAIASRLGPEAVERYRRAYAESSDEDIIFYD